ncbi:MAG: enoyl-CoA hydratase/isomerase family protein [Microbacterium sp.]|uniref:enoyl-CoA hydratase/isomerase family protein n=1 Tax=Microbacterium sp. TaxID=51671 RepID=UPI0039E4DAB8
MSADALLVEEHDERVVITLNRPEVRNTIDARTVRELHAACAELERRPRVAIITGADGVFAAGADIRELRERGAAEAMEGINSSVFERVAALPLPTIAAVGGAAIGGGAELAYACDIRVGTNQARFGNPEGGLGILAAAGATWRLPELIGMARAKEMLFAGRQVSAEKALDIGLLSEIAAEDDLLAVAHAWADRMMRTPPLALRLAKTALRAPRDAHPAIDDIAQAVLFETADKRSRMDAFLAR